MATTIKLKNSVTTTNTPSSLAQGEVAINITDKKVWVGNAATTPVQLLGDGGSATFSSITVTGVSTFSAGTVSAPSITTSGDTNTGIYFPAADTIAFTEGGVESMRIDSSGNMAIGNSSPAARLDIQQANPTRGIFQRVYNSTAGSSQTGAQIQFTQDSRADWVIGQPAATDAFAIWSGRNPSADGTERMRITSDGNVGIGRTPDQRFQIAASTAVQSDMFVGTTRTLTFYADATQTIIGAPTAIPMAFRTNDTERMRITSGGDLLIGNTDQNFRLSVLQSSNATPVAVRATNASFSNACVLLDAGPAAGTGYYHIQARSNYNSAATNVFLVFGNGNVQNTNNSYGSISDAKLKENIVDATPKLDKLMQVKVRNYNLIGDELKQIGVVAQELEQIFPNMIEENIDKDADGNDLGTTTKAVKYSVFVPMLLKAIQELNAKVEAQAVEIALLKSK